MKQPSPFSLSVVFEGQTPYLNFVNTIKSAKTISFDFLRKMMRRIGWKEGMEFGQKL